MRSGLLAFEDIWFRITKCKMLVVWSSVTIWPLLNIHRRIEIFTYPTTIQYPIKENPTLNLNFQFSFTHNTKQRSHGRFDWRLPSQLDSKMSGSGPEGKIAVPEQSQKFISGQILVLHFPRPVHLQQTYYRICHVACRYYDCATSFVVLYFSWIWNLISIISYLFWIWNISKNDNINLTFCEILPLSMNS